MRDYMRKSTIPNVAHPNMDVELGQCLMALPTLVTQMEKHSMTSSVDINLIEWFILRIELFLKLLCVLTRKLIIDLLLINGNAWTICICMCVLV